MIRHNDVNQSSLSEFSEPKKKERYNSITNEPSILTARIKQPKSSECTSSDWSLSVRSMRYCSRFETCSAPKCPLDVFIDLRTETEEDHHCTMARATRHKHWESMPEDLQNALPFQGYFESEFRRITAARERWESLPEDRKAEIRDRMKNARRQAGTFPKKAPKAPEVDHSVGGPE